MRRPLHAWPSSAVFFSAPGPGVSWLLKHVWFSNYCAHLDLCSPCKPSPLQDNWNKLDFVLVVLSLLDLIVSFLVSPAEPSLACCCKPCISAATAPTPPAQIPACTVHACI